MFVITARWNQKGSTSGSIHGSSKGEKLEEAAVVPGEWCLGYRVQDHSKALMMKKL